MRTFRNSLPPLKALPALLLLGVLLPLAGRAQFPPVMFEVENIAQVQFDDPEGNTYQQQSNTVVVSVRPRDPATDRTDSVIQFYEHRSQNDQSVLFQMPSVEYRDPAGHFHPVSDPTNSDGTPVDLNPSGNGLLLTPANLYHGGAPIFLSLVDLDQNLDPFVQETVLVHITVSENGEEEELRLYETGPDDGIFVGYIQSTTDPMTPYDGKLSVVHNSMIEATYSDVYDPDSDDTSAAAAFVDPLGVVFDTSNGSPVSGATVTLLNNATGQPATVYGDDGSSSYPATVTSGGTASDSSGATYSFPDGAFRFPLIDPGDYRFAIELPPGYTFTDMTKTQIETKFSDQFVLHDAASFYDETSDRFGTFTVSPGPVVHIDIPIDPHGSGLFVRKQAASRTVGIGDFLRYDLSVENWSTVPVTDVVLTDILPRGFRYESGSAYLDKDRLDDPGVDFDGRTLQFDVGDIPPQTIMTVRYVVYVGSNAETGRAVNTAGAVGDGGAVESNTAEAEVQVQDDLEWKKVLMGRVFLRGDDSGTDSEPESDESIPRGIEGVRIYMEDGTYTISDEDGLFHFEGIEPGTHVVQMDTESLPERYVPVGIPNTRFAGSSFSQFVDLKTGGIWRTDFPVGLRPPPEGEVEMRLSSIRRGDTVRCTVELSGKTVPVENPILMVMLPGSLKLDETACQVDGASFEPELSGPVVTFRLQDGEGDWQRKVELSAELVEESADGTAKAVVMFDTPTQKRQRMPVAEISVLEEHSDSGALSADTVGAYETDEPETDESEDDRDADEHGAGWLNGLEPGIEWVEPGPGYMPPIPSLNLGIKHEPHQSITLLLEGEKVNTLNFEGSLKNSDKTVVVSRWRGIDLEEGDNHFEAIVADREGKEIARLARMFHYSGKPVKVEFLPERSVLVADGRTVPAIAVRLTDKDGYPARERVVGEYSVFSPFVPYRDESVEQDILLPEGDARWRPRYRVGKDGVAMLELEPTTRSGEAVISLRLQDGDEEIRAWLEPALREWILVGFAEGTAGYQTLEEHARALPDDERFEDFTHDDRIAFFAKGQIKGEWLLTIAYDNTKESTQQHDRESLNQIIDPDSFYTLYGDDTVQDYEAPSAEKLYVKIERSKFYAMYGDYETGLTVTDLSAYSRSLTGLKTEYRGDRFQFNAFATETNQAFVKDEIRGDGTSGLYHLSRDSIVINSENVTIETRDRFHSERILDSSTLTRHLDYNIDYNAGTIYFKRPVMSRDEELNPIYIVVDYESVDQGDRSYTYGGRGAAKMLDDKIEVGATHIHEGRVGGEGELNGIDLAYDITENTRFRAETARTETDFDGEKLVGTARLAEITHESGKLSATAYARDQEGEFGLGQQMGTESGTRKVGANAAYYLTEKLNITGEVYRQENTGTDSDRKVLNLAANYLGERLSLKGGYLAARDNLGDGSTNRSDEIQAGIGYAFFDQRLRLRVDHAQAISGNNESSDFPNRTIFGADYSLTERTRIFGEYEITEGGTEASQALRAGLGLVPWSGADLNTGITQEMRGNGNRTFANAGLFQTLQLTEEWSIDAGVDMTQSIKSRKGQTWNTDVPSASGGSEDFLAISLGATRQAENWTWSNRIEQRTSDTEDSHNLFTGVVGDVSRNLALSLSASLFNTDSATGEESMSADIRLGLAYRPLDPRWIVLDRLDLIYDDQTGDTIDTTTWRIVNHFDANYQPREDLQMSFRYACKFVSETVEKDDFSGFTDLFGFEARYDIFERWDIGFRTSARHSWNTNQLAYSFGPSLGFSPAKNFWISVGYNVDGFDDRDFGRTGYTGQGAYVQFRMKFDQETAGELREYLNN